MELLFKNGDRVVCLKTKSWGKARIIEGREYIVFSSTRIGIVEVDDAETGESIDAWFSWKYFKKIQEDAK